MLASHSVIIPTYNGSLYIAEALNSVLVQSRPPNEIIVVDDCSLDNTTEVVKTVSTQSSLPIKLIQLQRNSGGPARPINVGVNAANSELISVLDHDDVYLPDKLQNNVEALEQNPGASIASGLLAFHNNPDVVPPGQLEMCRELGIELSPRSVTIPGANMMRYMIVRSFHIGGCSAFTFRKKHWQDKGGMDESLPLGADCDFLCYLCERGDIIIRPKIQHLRRIHQNNFSRKTHRIYLDFARVKARYLNTHRWILNEESDSRALSDFFNGLSFSLRDAGYHGSALECYRMRGKIWGWDQSLLMAMTKLPLHWLFYLCGIKKPVDSPYTTDCNNSGKKAE